MPVICTDVVFFIKDEKAIYLGKRSVFPMQGIWVFGGRVQFNDNNFEEAISRLMKGETGYDFDPKRFQYLCTNSYAWVKTAQGDFPGKNVSITHSCEITKEELEKIAQGLNPKEYDVEFGIQRFDHERLIKEKVHPALMDMYLRLFSY